MLKGGCVLLDSRVSDAHVDARPVKVLERAAPRVGLRNSWYSRALGHKPLVADCLGPALDQSLSWNRSGSMPNLKQLIRNLLPEPLEIRLQALDHYYRGEPELRDLPRVCDKGRLSLDIGANIGTYSYFLRRNSSRVVAYEPHPVLAARLRRLFADVDVREKAVSDAPGTLDLVVPVADGRAMHELGSIKQDFSDEEVVERHSVEVVTIDDEGFDDVGFIKIDVEQNEIPVLRGASETLVRCRPVVMTEVTPLLYEKSLVETFAFMGELGYQGWFTFEGVKRPFADFVPEQHANRALFGTRFMNANVFFVPDGVAVWGRTAHAR